MRLPPPGADSKTLRIGLELSVRAYIDVVKRIKIQYLRWLDHVLRMDSSNPVRKVFESEPGGGSRRKGRPRQRWAEQVGEDLTTLCIRNWRQAAAARDVWRCKLAEAKICNRF